MKKILATLFSFITISIVLAQGGGGPSNPCRACFPNSNGHAGEFLQTNGVGGLSWQPGGGVGTSLWDTTGGTFSNTEASLPILIASANAASFLRINTSGIQISNSYYLPSSEGAAGQIITTDGAGFAVWQDNTAIRGNYTIHQVDASHRDTLIVNRFNIVDSLGASAVQFDTLVFPASPSDGDYVEIKTTGAFSISAGKGITLVGNGATILNNIAITQTLTVGTLRRWVYYALSNVWI